LSEIFIPVGFLGVFLYEHVPCTFSTNQVDLTACAIF